MTRGINKVILVGRLGADPDLRFAPNGTAVARFNIATTERVPLSEGNWEDRTEWHRIVVFGKLAEACRNYLAKGSLIYVEGRLRTQQWTDSQGVKRSTTEIVAKDIQFLDSGSSQKESVSKPYLENRKEYASDSMMPEDLPSVPLKDQNDDDIPF
ncbi:MAG: single-stranded DNA-binding protein [Syntrophobacterales bacterium]|nr:single-stranded DNA-binding protein [Syntrophobacterales bacterium]